jgi:hypothetical protein
MPTPNVEELAHTPFSRARNLRFFLYLLKQPFMLVPGLLVCVAWWSLLWRGQTLGAAMLMGPVFGIGGALLLGLCPFVLMRKFSAEGTEAAFASESKVFESKAVHWLGDEARQGMLIIAANEICFAPDRYAVQRSLVRIPVRAITNLRFYRSPVPEGFQSTSTLTVETPGESSEFLFYGLDLAAVCVKSLTGTGTLREAERSGD